jgi:hypothetical protein
MGEQDGPRIADPVMKADVAFGGVGCEIRGGIANLKSHYHLLPRMNSLNSISIAPSLLRRTSSASDGVAST